MNTRRDPAPSPSATVTAADLRAGETVHTTWGTARVARTPERLATHPALVCIPLATAGPAEDTWTVRADRPMQRAQD